MMSERPGKEPIHVILTAGHVIPELTQEMYVVEQESNLLCPRLLNVQLKASSQRPQAHHGQMKLHF